jgi:hypothetical protein
LLSLYFEEKMMNASTALSPIKDDEFLPPADFCRKFRYSYSTLSKYIRMGEIAVHQFSDAPRPMVNVAEALRVMSTIKRPYTAPAVRLVRHDDKAVASEPRKQTSDLFA